MTAGVKVKIESFPSGEALLREALCILMAVNTLLSSAGQTAIAGIRLLSNGYSLFDAFSVSRGMGLPPLCFALSVHADDEHEIHEGRDEGEQDNAP